MTMKLLLMAAFVSLLLASYANADDLQATVATNQLGIEGADITYREPSLSVKETGPLGGVYGVYDYRAPDMSSNVIHVDGHVDYSNVDYTGSGKIDDISDVLGEPRIWLGHDFDLSQTRLTPYIGAAYRILYDHVEGKTSSTGAQGYNRLSQYLYSPVGFEIKTDVITGWRFGFNAEYDIFIHGWQRSYLSTFQGVPDIINNQSHAYGVRGSFDIIKKEKHVDFVISPYIRYWNVKQSSSTTSIGTIYEVSGYEPANHSVEAGCRFGVEF